jgi:Tat protein secretion system quality control protein TatD with DNase activity
MMVRIYKVNRVSLKSKKYCKENPGEYPPALEPVLKKRQSFEQIHGLSLEDASEAWELAGEVLENFLTNVGMKPKKAGKWRKKFERSLKQMSEAATAIGVM